MNGIPKGLCSFGRVTPHKMGRCPKDRGCRTRLVSPCKRGRSLNGTSRTPSPTFFNGRIISAPASASRCFRQFGLHSLCAVSDVQAWTLISVSEFTSGTVARVQRHAASVRLQQIAPKNPKASSFFHKFAVN